MFLPSFLYSRLYSFSHFFRVFLCFASVTACISVSLNISASPIWLIISRRALAREGDYEMMSVCACVRAYVRALVSHADSSKTTTATDFL